MRKISASQRDMQMSDVQKRLSEYLDTRETGKEGSIASVVYARNLYALDTELRPSYRGMKQSPKVALTNYGGFISAYYEISAREVVEWWGTTIQKSYLQLDRVWELDTEEFIELMNNLTDAISAGKTAQEAYDEEVGRPVDKLATTMMKAAEKVGSIHTRGGHITRAAELALISVRDDLNKVIGTFAKH